MLVVVLLKSVYLLSEFKELFKLEMREAVVGLKSLGFKKEACWVQLSLIFLAECETLL